LQLPIRENAYIQPQKITGYLLSESHSVGKSKAKFFREVGFNDTNIYLLEQELLTLAQSHEVAESSSTSHGKKYVIVGSINTPLDRQVTILTVWIIDIGEVNPRFVTARPFKAND
jgi:hypothetical protein